MCACKSDTHVTNYCKYKLSKSSNVLNNIVDPSKTLVAPYSQGNEFTFGRKAGWQCIAMSLCSHLHVNEN